MFPEVSTLSPDKVRDATRLGLQAYQDAIDSGRAAQRAPPWRRFDRCVSREYRDSQRRYASLVPMTITRPRSSAGAILRT
jgi:hypothetical protein